MSSGPRAVEESVPSWSHAPPHTARIRVQQETTRTLESCAYHGEVLAGHGLEHTFGGEQTGSALVGHLQKNEFGNWGGGDRGGGSHGGVVSGPTGWLVGL